MSQLTLTVPRKGKDDLCVQLSDRLTVGRSNRSGVVIDGDRELARCQFTIVADGADWYLESTGEVNKTVVDGHVLAAGERRILKPGSIIRAGNTDIKILAAADDTGLPAARPVSGLHTMVQPRPDTDDVVVPDAGAKADTGPPVEPPVAGLNTIEQLRPGTGTTYSAGAVQPPAREAVQPDPPDQRASPAPRPPEPVAPRPEDQLDADSARQAIREQLGGSGGTETHSIDDIRALPKMRERRPQLVVKSGKIKKVHTLGATRTTIGRHEETQIQIRDKGVSERQAELCFDGTQFLLANLSSQGTTLVGDQAVTGPTPILSHALLRFGTVDAVFLCQEPGCAKAERRFQERAANQLQKLEKISKSECREAILRAREQGDQSVAAILLMKTHLLPSEWAESAASVGSSGSGAGGVSGWIRRVLPGNR